MMNVLEITPICDDVNVLKLLLIIKNIIMIGKLAVPLLLIIMATIDIYKGYIINAGKDSSRINQIVGKRLLAAILVFYIPTVVYLVVDSLDESSSEIKKCFSVTNESIENQKQSASEKCTKDGNGWNPVSNTCSVTLNTNIDDSYIRNYYQKVAIKDRQQLIIMEEANENSHDGAQGGRTTSITPAKKIKRLNFYNQGSYGVTFTKSGCWMSSGGCGLASFAMIASSYSDPKYTPPYVANYFKNTLNHNHCYTRTEDFANDRITGDFGLDYVLLFDHGKHPTEKNYVEEEGNEILRYVQAGWSIMLFIPKHYVAVGPHYKCNSNQVYLYNPAGGANDGCYTPEKLFNNTYNWRSRCTNPGYGIRKRCGWRSAIAFKNK